MPSSVIMTPTMLTRAAMSLPAVKLSPPMVTPKRSVKRPEVDERMVVLATLVIDRAALERYCERRVHSKEREGYAVERGKGAQ